MIYPGEGKKGQPKAGDYVLAAEQARAEAAASPHQFTAVDLASADRWEAQARTKQLPSTRTEIGAGGELIDREDRWDELGVVNTVADPDYVTASASRERPQASTRQARLQQRGPCDETGFLCGRIGPHSWRAGTRKSTPIGPTSSLPSASVWRACRGEMRVSRALYVALAKTAQRIDLLAAAARAVLNAAGAADFQRDTKGRIAE